MIGAFAGDIIGSRFERHNKKDINFILFTKSSRFTDDSVLTAATAAKLMYNGDFASVYKDYGQKFGEVGWGKGFRDWIKSDPPMGPYKSFGNGSAMRVSPIAYAYESMKDVLYNATKSSIVTHNHIEGIRGAQAVAAAVFLARKGNSKKYIKYYISKTFNYNLNRSIDEIRKIYTFTSKAEGSVPEAIIAFLESTDFENAIRLAISIGGDSDTIASISGAIAEAYYKEIPLKIVQGVFQRLDKRLNFIVRAFYKKYKIDTKTS